MSNLLLPLPVCNADGQINVKLSSIGRTNRICSKEEETYIRSIMLTAQQHRKEEFMDLIGRCKVALAPRKKLPPDVLRSIFHFCNEGEMKFPLSKRGVLRITHVCSAWRQLALETPSLWSGVRILMSSTDRSRHYQAFCQAMACPCTGYAQVVVHSAHLAGLLRRPAFT